jgi:hypothetical protein
MGEAFGRTTKLLAVFVGISLVSLGSVAHAQGEPPSRVGRLAFVDGTVSFHDDEQSGWTKAVVNTPLTTGDALWTEPNARSEVSLAGTRIRMEGGTELGVAQLDDAQVRLQMPQGRIDVKTFSMDPSQPYQIQTPRGTITLQQQGDYYVEAGTTEDPTRLGVRAGAAQIEGLDGKVLAVRAGEVGEARGDGSAMQLRTIRAAPPAPPAYWASRDRQVIYDQQPQYVPAGMTGYEDLNAYGSWSNDGDYGQVWSPRNVPAGWAPYRTGHWSYVKPWGWTWIDEQPWGFAPYHYGRWANSRGRWVWVPPQREQRPVYAPALVAFVGGIELAIQLGNQSTAPVGWFPLGPREVYVPSYTTNRDYYRRLNRAAQIQDRDLDERWERAQRREAFIAGRNSVLMNQRFATVVPTQAFVQSQPVQRAALRVAPEKVAAAAVAPVSAPPAPTASVAAVAATPAAPDNTAKPADPKAADPKAADPKAADPKAAGQKAPAATPAPAPAVDAKAKADAEAKAKAAAPNVAVGKTAVAEMPTLAKPATTETKKPASPGPKVAATEPKASTDPKDAKPAAPQLRPRQGAAPPQIKETDKPAMAPAPQAAPQAPNQGAPKQDAPKQAAPAPAPAPAPQAAPQPQRQEPPKQAAPAPQKPEAQPQREEPPKQAAPAPAPAPQQPRQEQPRQQAVPPAPQPQPQQQRLDVQPQRPPAQQAQPPQQQPQPPRQNNERPNNAPKADERPQQQGQAPAPAPAPAPQRRDNDDKKDDKK